MNPKEQNNSEPQTAERSGFGHALNLQAVNQSARALFPVLLVKTEFSALFKDSVPENQICEGMNKGEGRTQHQGRRKTVEPASGCRRTSIYERIKLNPPKWPLGFFVIA